MANTKVQSEQIADDAVVTSHIADNVGLGGSPTTTTQSPSDNSTKIATTAYVDAAYAALVDSSPATLNTLNELAAALGDDANFSTTVTNSIATKVALSGSGQTIADSGDFTLDAAGSITLDAGGDSIKFKDDGTQFGKIRNISSNLYLYSDVQDKDIVFRGNDNGADVDALTLDMSDAGSAFFNADVYVDKYFRLRTTDDQANQWLLYTNTNDSLEFNYNGSGNAEVVVDTSGNVGIGTTSPTSTSNVTTLEVSNATTARLLLDSTGTGGRKYGWYTSVDGQFAVYDYDASAERLRVDSSGRVGIGTTSPSTKLHLGGTAPLDSIIRQDSTSSGTNWEIGERAAGKWQIFEDDNDSIVATFMSTGRVGIGTESPDNKLHIYAGDSGHTWSYDSGDYLIIENSDSVAMNMASPSSNQNLILFSDNAARGIGLIGYNHSEDTLRFHANGEQRLKLSGASSGEAAMKITQGSETGGQLLIRSNYSDPHYLATQGTNHSSGGWYWGYGVEMSGSGTTKSTFSNFNGARSFVQLFGDRIQYNFAGAQNTTIGNAVSLTESVRIDAQGIKFNGDTATANALSDYEEGSWTPTAAVTLTTTTACRYVKVGNHVTITFDIEFASTSSGNQVTFGNLPFSLTTYNGGYTNWQNTGSGIHLHCSGTNAYLYNIVSNAAFTLAAVSGKRIIGTIVGIAA